MKVIDNKLHIFEISIPYHSFYNLTKKKTFACSENMHLSLSSAVVIDLNIYAHSMNFFCVFIGQCRPCTDWS